MDRWTEIVVLIAMFVLRLGVPVALTVAVAFLLRRLDKKWEADAEREAALAPTYKEPAASAPARSLPCWLIKGCSAEESDNCPARQNQSLPCWLARLRADGRIPQLCAGCDMFRSPALGQS